MAKDRLPELLSRRNSVKSNRVKSGKTKSSPGEEFLTKAASLFNDIDELQNNVQEVERIQRDILASPHTNAALDNQLSRLTATVKEKAFAIRSALKRLEEDASPSSPLLSSAEDRMKSSQYAALTRQLMDVMNKYNEIQLNYREKCKTCIIEKLNAGGNLYSDEELEKLLDNKNPAIFTQAILADTEAAKRSLSDIEARHADIIQLEKTIEELRDLMATVAFSVQNQSDLINHVEYNVNKAADSVANGRQQLTQARKRLRKNRRRKFICIIVLFVLALVVIIIIASAIGLT